MTHLSKDLDQICREWCPMFGYCEEDRECYNRRQLKKVIKEIAETGETDLEDD